LQLKASIKALEKLAKDQDKDGEFAMSVLVLATTVISRIADSPRMIWAKCNLATFGKSKASFTECQRVNLGTLSARRARQHCFSLVSCTSCNRKLLV
jgi:hypothetical protein